MNSADTADQAVKMTLEGIEMSSKVVLELGGKAASSLAAFLYAVLTDKKKVKGKARLDTLLKSGKELKVFAIRGQDLKKFCQHAKNYGVLYSVLKEKNNSDGIVDIMVRAEDGAKIARIVDKLEIATVDTKAIRESVLNQRQHEAAQPSLSEQQHDVLLKKLMDEQSPKKARTHKKTGSVKVSEQPSRRLGNSNRSAKNSNEKTNSKPSVRKQLNEYKKTASQGKGSEMPPNSFANKKRVRRSKKVK